MKTVLEIFGVTPKEGEIGIEIEMEGNVLYPDPGETVGAIWKGVEDPSLRGMALEYVLIDPAARQDVSGYLEVLAQYLKKNKVKLIDTDRCGVHVHVNCQQLSFKQLINFVCLYLIFEDLLVKWCGESREGNLFCLRARDAEYITTFLQKAVIRGAFGRINEQEIRYASINVAALAKYGSVEFRSMPTPDDLSLINTWVEMLLAVKDASLTYNETYEMVEGLSAANSTEAFLNMVFKDNAKHLVCPEMDKLLMEGVRRVQDLAYLPKILKARNKDKPSVRVRKSYLDSLDDFGPVSQTLYDNLISANPIPTMPQPLSAPQPAWYEEESSEELFVEDEPE